MKKTILALGILAINLVTSCSSCKDSDDRYFLLSEEDKKLHLVNTSTEKTYIQDNAIETSFKFHPTEINLHNIRMSDDEVCSGDYCEQAMSKIEIKSQNIDAYIIVENTLNQGLYRVLINDHNNNTSIYYNLIDKNGTERMYEAYNTNSFSFKQFVQDFEINNKTYNDVLVLRNNQDFKTKYIIVKPSFELLYLEYNNLKYEVK